MITIRNLNLSFGPQILYDSISCTISQDQRIGLVGRNGVGKSTLLALIAQGSIPAISTAKNRRIAYLPQEVILTSSRSILDETFTAFDDIHHIMEQITILEKQLHDSPDNAQLLEHYASLQEQLVSHNPGKALAEAKQMLMGLGFSQQQFDQPVISLSVGWKMRIVLAKLLLQKADFYLFDEPTNHLDIIAKDWFLDFLKKAPFGFLIVCHERYFLNQLCTHILELELGKAKIYTGNYHQYEEQKERDTSLLEEAFNQQQKEIKAKEEWIARFRAKSSKAKMAQSMMKTLDKLERITLPPSPKNIHFTFPPLKPSGTVVLQVKSLSFAFEQKLIFKKVDLSIERGAKVALIAANGVGKTTLFNLLISKYTQQSGSISFGYQVKAAVFEQEQAAALDLNKSILENIEATCPKASMQIIRNFLGSFLFSNDDVEKKVKVLSGGEKNKVGMIKVLLQNANFLLLDEPTNHLDIPSKEVLLKALKEYQGTVFFVSHDHDFINELASQVIELTPSGALKYEGNYDSYVYHKRMLVEPKASIIKKTGEPHASLPEKPSSGKDIFEHNKKIKSLEKKIDHLEREMASLQQQFETIQYGSPTYSSAQKKLQSLQQEHCSIMNEWELLHQNS